MLNIDCPHCGKGLAIPEKYSGQTGKCNGCGQAITVPTVEQSAPPTTPLPTAAPASPAIDVENIEIEDMGEAFLKESYVQGHARSPVFDFLRKVLALAIMGIGFIAMCICAGLGGAMAAEKLGFDISSPSPVVKVAFMGVFGLIGFGVFLLPSMLLAGYIMPDDGQ